MRGGLPHPLIAVWRAKAYNACVVGHRRGRHLRHSCWNQWSEQNWAKAAQSIFIDIGDIADPSLYNFKKALSGHDPAWAPNGQIHQKTYMNFALEYSTHMHLALEWSILLRWKEQKMVPKKHEMCSQNGLSMDSKYAQNDIKKSVSAKH